MVDKYYATEYERQVLERLQAIVAALPSGAVDFEVRGYPKAIKPTPPWFELRPRNPRSVILEGVIVEGQGIDISIGNATSSEFFFKPATDGKTPRGEERFFRFCHSIFTNYSSETVIRNRHGRVIWATVLINVETRPRHIGGGWPFWWLARGRTKTHYLYEPYY